MRSVTIKYKQVSNHKTTISISPLLLQCCNVLCCRERSANIVRFTMSGMNGTSWVLKNAALINSLIQRFTTRVSGVNDAGDIIYSDSGGGEYDGEE